MSESAGSASGGLGELLVSNVVELVTAFAKVATQDPLSAVSLAMGAVFVLAASGVLGYLVGGALLDLLGASPNPR